MNPNTVNSIPLFASVPRRRRKVVASWADEVDVPAGYELTRQGGYAQEFFVVVSGTADVFRDAEHVGALESGDFFGEAGLLGARWEHTATVVATAPMRLLVFARQQFRELLFALPTVAASIRRAVDERASNPGVAVRARSPREFDEVPRRVSAAHEIALRSTRPSFDAAAALALTRSRATSRRRTGANQ